MNELMMYILVLIALALTISFSWFLIVFRSLEKMNKVFDKDFEAMTQRINERSHLSGSATKHEIDLAAKERRGGWTGAVTGKEHLNLKLSEPHPFYSKEADDE